MKLNKVQILFPLFAFIFSCVSNEKRMEMVKLSQYMVEGMTLYRNNCANCHGIDGKGLARVIPPLKNADYLLTMTDDLLACQIKNGLSDSIIVNGDLYFQPMPGIKKLTALEAAELVTYVNNTWGKESGLYGVKKAEKALLQCY